MKGIVILPVLLLIAYSLSGQSDEIENWRSAGFKAKSDNEFDSAIFYYSEILSADPGDYDARLALGRLYILTEDYKTAISLFDEIFMSDSTDVEALNGLGACYGLLGKEDRSALYYEKALSYYQEDMQQYFYLAKAYGNGGRLEEAIEIYREVISIDDTYSEAWAGIGKIYYWMGKPQTAGVFYEKALELDPDNEEIKKEFTAVRHELDYSLSINFGPVNETEESYEINALISKVGFEKRINDHFHIQAGFLLDYSNRNYTGDKIDTTRWYSTTWVKGSWITPHHKLSAYGGYTATDKKFSSYGLDWKLNYNPGKVTIKNTLNGGYDYFYYWNKVGSTSFTDEAQLEYRFIGLSARASYGLVDQVAVYDDDAEDGLTAKQNPYQSFGASLFFKVFKNPVIKLGLNYSYLDYTYKSPLYYSPFGRNLTGASTSVYYKLSAFFIYGSFAYNLGTEYTYGNAEDDHINVDNWSTNIELGYDAYPFSFSIGGSNFYNPYYQNLTGFIALKILF
jgi:tetratricopeptide (TPR) repeat protein